LYKIYRNASIQKEPSHLVGCFFRLNRSVDLGYWSPLGVAYAYLAFSDHFAGQGNGYYVSKFVTNGIALKNLPVGGFYR
jgi:hypothetical protein